MTAQPATTSNAYSRQNPSERYRQLLAMYNQMHLHGSADTKPEEMFPGVSLPPHVERITALIKRTGTETLLDYGCGKGILYRADSVTIGSGTYPSIKAFWGLKAIALYDPAYPPYMTLPQGTFDGVICTDVLEHCPEEDMPWILGELFAYGKKFVFGNIACYPARKILPNGENAHCTIRPATWWQALIERVAAPYPQVEFQFVVTEFTPIENGLYKRVEHTIDRLR